MKKLTFVALMVAAVATAFGQDMRDGTHIFNYDVTLKKCDYTGANETTAEKIDAGTRFTIRTVTATDYIIRITKFTSGGAAATANNQRLVTDASNNLIFFKLSKTLYDAGEAEAFKKRGAFTVGAATTLIKIRPGSKEPKNGYNIYSEFGNDFNIGLSAGWKLTPYRKMALSHSIVGGLSFSSIKVTPYTTQNYVKAESTQGCVTFSAGYVFEYDKFQVSAFSGIDVMSGEVGRNWIYRGRPWIGLGFGFQIFRGQGEKGN